MSSIPSLHSLTAYTADTDFGRRRDGQAPTRPEPWRWHNGKIRLGGLTPYPVDLGGLWWTSRAPEDRLDSTTISVVSVDGQRCAWHSEG